MKRKIFSGIIFFCFTLGVFAQELVVEGISYLTRTPIAISIENGMIVKIEDIKELKDGGTQLFVAPGLIDNQVNGFNNVSFSFGGGELTPEGIIQATKALWERGVTSYLPTLTTNSQAILVKNVGILSHTTELEEVRGSIPGYHLEGP